MSALSSIPFVGREAVLADLHQFLRAPTPIAPSLQAVAGFGRSSLLRRLVGIDERFVYALLPVTPYSVTHEGIWLETLADAARAALIRDDFDAVRLPALDSDQVRDWLTQSFLPAVGHVLRDEARLVWLLDDVQVLGRAIAQGTIPEDEPTFLYTLLTQFPFISMITSADEDAAHTDQLTPLVQIAHVTRLGTLSRFDVEALLAAALENVPETLADRVYQASGGWPRVLNEMCEALRRFEPLEDALDSTYERVQTEYRRHWDKLTRDERIVLTAVVNLLYEDPLRPITLPLLEVWLAESDDPMDGTAIAAQIRGLEYRWMLRQTRDGIYVQSGLLQRWLLEHARLEATSAAGASRVPMLLVIVLIVVIVAALLLGISQLPAAGVATAAPLPTLTLGS